MQSKCLTWLILLMLAIALPTIAQDEGGEEPAAEEETILGAWYLQYAEGDPLPKNMSLKLDFKEDGQATGTMTMEDAEPETRKWKYEHDEENAKLTLYVVDDEGNVEEDPEVLLAYSFDDGVLIFRYREDPDDDEQTMELTRNPEGTERHQKLREEQGDDAGGIGDIRNLEGVEGVIEKR